MCSEIPDPQASQKALLRSGLMSTCPTTITSNDSCSICLESCTTHFPSDCPTKEGGMPATITIRECGHIFHPDCLFNWLADHSTCPMCRRKLYKRMVWVWRLMVFLPDVEGEEIGRSIMCTEAAWNYEMSLCGPGPQRDTLMGAEWWRYCTEVMDGESVVRQ
ncbi:hypothetical protein HBH98_218560 [Parastagonospora nodorum]|nr:hypothetical protein HBH53_086260 [Parastagonospora nodorum]KAH4067001.1 hypothetical protein HBH50_145860 [Parastagonospora nodorum]KAH4085934.1 hypothetical protein HBH48_144010 [Parastagonospora nodorum]KAH4169585.1 hypothetical protein HBH43_108070 [Parastagonospora nodorum]KAH4189442.1 hypothetical protein HBH42_143780 [Parastagonospora nodorum]